MLREGPAPAREPRTIDTTTDLVIVGGGLAGCCAAITAARLGLKVTLVHDRPVPGGNASSEVRLWVLGATCHMGSNNRWAREGGVIDELLLENLYRNPEGNPLIFDTVLLEMLTNEPNLTLLLNTSAYECDKDPDNPDRITSVTAFCSQNSTRYVCRAPLFLDSSGDGILGFLAGAAFRMGAESKEEFDEPFAPSGEFGYLLGHSMYFYSKDTGRPVNFIPPAFAMKNVPERIPRFRQFNSKQHGCHLWWIEYGGRLDTVHETETIKWELWKVVYGVWDYIKNSGKFPEAANLALEWVSHIPGKRESRRFEGPHMLTQRDVVHRPKHADSVAHGGWSIDLHPADGVFSAMAGSHHLHSKGPYGIPYRCYLSRNISNLFLGGRIISSTHVAFGTIRVMGTGAVGGQAVAAAAYLCRKLGCSPADVGAPDRINLLQRELLRIGQHIPGYRLEDPADLAASATIKASSEFAFGSMPANGPLLPLEKPTAQMFPLRAGPVPKITLEVEAAAATDVSVRLLTPARQDNHTPDTLLAERAYNVPAGKSKIVVDLGVKMPQAGYLFVALGAVAGVSVRCSELRCTGVVSVQHRRDERTAKVGGEDYDVWVPTRRPRGQNLAITLDPPPAPFPVSMLRSGVVRPTHESNAWVADPTDPSPTVALSWQAAQKISRVELFFDPDADYGAESVLMGHAENVMPMTVKHFRLKDDKGTVLHETTDNRQGHCTVRFDPAISTRELKLECVATQSPHAPASVFAVYCYNQGD